MASFTKFNQFSTDLSTGKHNFGSHALYCGLELDLDPDALIVEEADL